MLLVFVEISVQKPVVCLEVGEGGVVGKWFPKHAV